MRVMPFFSMRCSRMVCGVESLSNVALNKDVRNQRQAPEGKRQYKKVRTCSGREEVRNRPVRRYRLDAGSCLDARGASFPKSVG